MTKPLRSITVQERKPDASVNQKRLENLKTAQQIVANRRKHSSGVLLNLAR